MAQSPAHRFGQIIGDASPSNGTRLKSATTTATAFPHGACQHEHIWSEIADESFHLPPGKPLTLVSYSAGDLKQAFIDPVTVGDELPQMPLFLEARFYVPVPLERTYLAAFDAVPKRWRDELFTPWRP